ncbi:hypothetical protein diail_11887 [Diaporthe ilicicola]|nr:hypothetical protein diail_11887 [Diaporthe ilicicola]
MPLFLNGSLGVDPRRRDCVDQVHYEKLARSTTHRHLINMHFPTARLLAMPLALSGLALAEQFHLTIVPEDGSSTYPVSIAVVSRAALILSSALEYNSLFTFNR